jgi:hypothetical protein
MKDMVRGFVYKMSQKKNLFNMYMYQKRYLLVQADPGRMIIQNDIGSKKNQSILKQDILSV